MAEHRRAGCRSSLFGFIRGATDVLLSNGTIRVWGGINNELEALRPGEMITLTHHNGRKYVVMLAEDCAKIGMKTHV